MKTTNDLTSGLDQEQSDQDVAEAWLSKLIDLYTEKELSLIGHAVDSYCDEYAKNVHLVDGIDSVDIGTV